MEIRIGSTVIRKPSRLDGAFIDWCNKHNIKPTSVFIVQYIYKSNVRVFHKDPNNTFTAHIENMTLFKPKKDHFPAWW